MFRIYCLYIPYIFHIYICPKYFPCIFLCMFRNLFNDQICIELLNRRGCIKGLLHVFLFYFSDSGPFLYKYIFPKKRMFIGLLDAKPCRIIWTFRKTSFLSPTRTKFHEKSEFAHVQQDQNLQGRAKPSRKACPFFFLKTKLFIP